MGHLLGSSMVGLMLSSCKRAYATCWVTQVCCSQSPCPHSRPLLTHASTGDTHSKQIWLSLCGASGAWCTQGFDWALGACLVVWDLILNVTLPLLLSCWGFFFVLGHGVSFFGGIQHSPDDGCSAGSCSFGVLTGGNGLKDAIFHRLEN